MPGTTVCMCDAYVCAKLYMCVCAGECGVGLIFYFHVTEPGPMCEGWAASLEKMKSCREHTELLMCLPHMMYWMYYGCKILTDEQLF